MADIFISYAREDRDRIEKLAAALGEAGYSVWWDRHIQSGAEFSKDIEAELNRASAVIVAWSSPANDSRWVKDEANAAAEEKKLLAISLDGVMPPLGFREYHSIDFSGWSGGADAPAFKELANAVHARLKGGAPTTAPGTASDIASGLASGLASGPTSVTGSSLASKFLRPAPLAAFGAGLAAIVLSFIFLGGEKAPMETPAAEATADTSEETSANSIAVLPFADLSPQEDQAYFSDGISEEILNVLTRVDGLKVASRTSSFAFKDRSGLSVPAIAAELGVAHVLEGSVRKAGDKVRITAQLIAAGDDKHLWSQTFDRQLSVDNLFQIQDEIARTIVEELGARMSLGPAETMRFAAAGTHNLEAYEAYLEGRDLFLARTDNTLPTIIERFEKAVRLDPEFARGWEALAATYSVAPSYYFYDQRDFKMLSRQAAERALALDDTLALPRGVMANLASIEDPPDFVRAFALLNEAIALDPQEGTLWNWRGQLYTELGFFDKADQDLKRALEVDPKDRIAKYWLAVNYLNMGEPDKAKPLLDPDDPFDRQAITRLVLAMYAIGRGDEVDDYLQTPDPTVDFDPARITQVVTDPGADVDAAYDYFRSVLTQLGVPADSQPENDWLYIFKKYDQIEPGPIATGRNVVWFHIHDDFIKSPDRKRLIREMGLDQYWRAHGFPPQCRPLGDDDFECD